MAAGVKAGHQGRGSLAEVALCMPELVPLPIQAQAAMACLCTSRGAAKSSLACTFQLALPVACYLTWAEE